MGSTEPHRRPYRGGEMTMAAIIGNGVLMASLVFLAGCNSGRLAVAPAPATQNATAVDPAQGEPEYWLNQPAVASASHRDFDKLWDAADAVSREMLFKIDRQNRRAGVLTTQ